MRFTPYFALAGAADPYQGIEFAARHSVIRGRDGRIIFESDVVAPTGWSPLAVDMLAQKYARKAGVPAATVRVPEADVPEWLQRSVPAAGTPLGGETDARQLFNRLAGCWTYWGWTLGYFDDEASARAFYADHCRMLALQLAAPNSPQWFNTGLYWAYGIKGADRGHWAFDPATGEVLPSRRSYVRPGASACHIQSIADNLVEPGGILDFTTREARVFQQGSGSGANYSPLRGTGEPLSGGGKSSGLMSFLPAIDRFAGAIKSGGTVRRAARMVVLDLDHPDAEEFVDWKVRQEHKVACLVAGSRVCRDAVAAVHACRLAGDAAGVDQAAARAAELGVPAGLVDQAERLAAEGLPPPAVPEFDTGYTGEAYETVTGQNANNSVGATAAFMRAVAEDADWPLYWRTERAAARAEGRPARPCKTVKARSLWDRVARAAWACADPGVQFHTTMEDWNPVPGDGPIDASNPCSEYLFIKDTSCNLGCLNLLSLVDPADWTETVVRIREAVRLYTVALDVTVSAAGYPSERLATGARDYRTLGLGYANLGALLMRNGLAYDSDAARGWAVALTALVHFGATATSAELAAAVGPFPRYAANRAGVDRVVRNHLAYVTDRAYDGLSVAPPDPGVALAAAPAELVAAAVAAGHTAVGVVAAHGLRNAQLTLLMPAGTVGLLMDCDTTGVEPDFALVKSKHLADDGWVTIVNQSVGPALTRLGYTGPAHDAVTAHVREYGTVEGCTALAPEHLPVFDCANKCGRAGTRFIAVAGHIRMMAAVQPLLSGGISKTCNMPAESTVADVRAAYDLAWRLGVKCVALYRDGSKLSQPLSTQGRTVHARTESPRQLSRAERRHLPNRRAGHTQKFRIGGHKFYLKTGEYEDGTLGEVFLTCDKEGGFLQSVVSAVAKITSIALQYGVPLDEIVNAWLFSRFEPNGPVQGHNRIRNGLSVFDVIARHLAIEYLARADLAHTDVPTAVAAGGTAAAGVTEPRIYNGTPCPSCEMLKMRWDGKCTRCDNCGATTGCV